MIKFESEKHFENYLKEYLPKLLPQKFPPDTEVRQQVKLDGYGICDLIFKHMVKHEYEKGKFEDEGYQYTIVEVKNEPLKYSHFAQVARYKEYFDRCTMNDEGNTDEIICFEYLLIAPYFDLGEVSDNDVCFLSQSSEDWVETYMLTIDHSRVMLQEVKGWFRSNSRHDFSFVEQQFLLNSEGK